MLLLVRLRSKECGNWKLDRLRWVKLVLNKHVDYFEPMCIQNELSIPVLLPGLLASSNLYGRGGHGGVRKGP